MNWKLITVRAKAAGVAMFMLSSVNRVCDGLCTKGMIKLARHMGTLAGRTDMAQYYTESEETIVQSQHKWKQRDKEFLQYVWGA